LASVEAMKGLHVRRQSEVLDLHLHLHDEVSGRGARAFPIPG
jgi:hypothetical protein